LIALVITIIVLLILAAITITSLTGDNGILNEAQSSKTNSDIEDAKTLAQADISEWMINTLASGGEAKLINDKQVADIIKNANENYDNNNKYYSDITQNDSGDYVIITKKGNEVLISSLYTPDSDENNAGTEDETNTD
jgi:hypothetical protein